MAKGFTYILTNTWRTVLYVGCTENLSTRIKQHKRGLIDGFTKKYNVWMLVYFEAYPTIEAARSRQRQLKGYRREKKENLVGSVNPSWHELKQE